MLLSLLPRSYRKSLEMTTRLSGAGFEITQSTDVVSICDGDLPMSGGW